MEKTDSSSVADISDAVREANEKATREYRDKMREMLEKELAEMEKDIHPEIVAMQKLQPGETCKLWGGNVFRTLTGWLYREHIPSGPLSICFIPDETLKATKQIMSMLVSGGLSPTARKPKPDKYSGEGAT